jgi:hypothetical protein
MIPSGIMKVQRGKMPFSIIIITICVLVFIVVLYAERLSFISSNSIFKFKPCPRKNTKPKSSKLASKMPQLYTHIFA